MRKFDMPKLDDPVSSVGERLRSYRKTKKLTLKQMAALTGISQPTLSEVENGYYDLSGEKLGALVRTTDINLHWLLTGEDEKLEAREEQSTFNDHQGQCCIPPEKRELLDAVLKVLSSGTIHAKALEQNIRAFHHAVQIEKRQAESDAKMEQMGKRMKMLEEEFKKLNLSQEQCEESSDDKTISSIVCSESE